MNTYTPAASKSPEARVEEALREAAAAKLKNDRLRRISYGVMIASALVHLALLYSIGHGKGYLSGYNDGLNTAINMATRAQTAR